jgi:hypothetical protein
MVTRDRLANLRKCLYGEGSVDDNIDADKLVDELYHDLDMRAAADELPSPEEIDDMARAAGLDGDPFRGGMCGWCGKPSHVGAGCRYK